MHEASVSKSWVWIRAGVVALCYIAQVYVNWKRTYVAAPQHQVWPVSRDNEDWITALTTAQWGEEGRGDGGDRWQESLDVESNNTHTHTLILTLSGQSFMW